MKVKSVSRLKDKSQIIQKGTQPYVTSAGVMIGVNYNPDNKCIVSDEDEFWQGVLLGIEPEWSNRRIARYVAYVIFLVVVFFAAILKGKEALQ